jgi:hypothetical protein
MKRYTNSRVEREWTTLYLIFSHWHSRLLLLKQGRTANLPQTVAPYLVSLCEAIAHVHALFPIAGAESRDIESLAAVLEASKIAGYHANPAPPHSTNLHVCLDDMYNLLSTAISATILTHDVL